MPSQGSSICSPPVKTGNLQRKNISSCKTALSSCSNIWEGYARPGSNAAVFTPYHITPGGGEKYLLSIVQAMQSEGMHVTVYVNEDNACANKSMLIETATALRVSLKPEKLDLKFWNDRVSSPTVFFVLGNGKDPSVENIGQLGFYMCQFPFDLDSPLDDASLYRLGTFDYVLLNSWFSFKWYNTFLSPAIDRFQKESWLFPSIEILHPPSSIHPYDDKANRQNIVLLGRFFEGRQSKGHKHAIIAFSKLIPYLPEKTKLILMGQLVLEQEHYLRVLKKQVARLGIRGRVEFMISVPPEMVTAQLRSAIIQWHLTGVEVDAEKDPASREHFGISIVEGMSAGCIPVALRNGGPEDIISHEVLPDAYSSHVVSCNFMV
jgi:glycosyltransferase involved in cell wall biosynthesis